MIHLALHFVVPAVLAGLFYKQKWQLAYLVLMTTMIVDIDHLFANPIYDPNRCSIGFHPLHEQWLILVYVLLCVVPKLRLVGIGLSVHMILDALDCL